MMEKRKKVPKVTDGQQRILAMKDGIEGYFSEEAWRIGKPERHGWIKVGVRSEAVEVETEEIVKTEIPDDVVVKVTTEGDDIYPTDDEIKDFLKEKGVKFHHATGTKKLRILYDENKE